MPETTPPVPAPDKTQLSKRAKADSSHTVTDGVERVTFTLLRYRVLGLRPRGGITRLRSILNSLLQYCEPVGLAGLSLFAFFAVLGGAGTEIGLGLMLLAMLPELSRVWRAYRFEPVFWLVVFGMAYIIASAWLAARVFPATRDVQWESAVDWLRLSPVLFVAWWLRGDVQRLTVVFLLFAGGALTRMLVYAPWDRLGDFVNMRLPAYSGGFGLWHISFSAYLAVICFGLALLVPPFIQSVSGPWRRGILWVFAVSVALFFLGAIVIARSRGTWLSMAATIIVTVPLYLFLKRREGGGSWHPRLWQWAAAGVVVVLFAVVAGPTVVHRMTGESETWKAIVEGPIEAVPQTSIGTRVHLYHLAVERWLERPMFGWGVGSHRMLLREENLDYNPSHFHNVFLEMLVRFGLVGTAIALSIVVIVYWRVVREYSRGYISTRWFVFLVAVLIFTFFWSQADIRIIKWDYRNFFILFFSMVMSLVPPWSRPLRSKAIHPVRREPTAPNPMGSE
jgi:O-antigen ligase